MTRHRIRARPVAVAVTSQQAHPPVRSAVRAPAVRDMTSSHADGPYTSGRWAAADLCADRPAIARIYEHLLGGARTFAAHRDAADHATATVPELTATARAN